jgi:outer membrane autotransporter protein
LRSTFISPTTPPGPPPTEPEVPPPVLPPDPPPPTLPPGLFPIIGPELATYGVVQPTARQLGLETLGTLNERIGDTMTASGAGAAGWTRADWGRFFGQQVDNHYQAFADPRAEGWMGGFQGGLDLWRGDTPSGHRDTAGIYFAYSHASMDVTGLITNAAATGYILTHTGMVNLDAYSAGSYWTHYGPSGWYVDAVLQSTMYRGDARTQFAELPAHGYGYAASLEGGYPIPLPLFGPRFVLEPQGQIIWQQISFNQENDGLGEVALGMTSGATGRLGLRGQWTIAGADKAVWQPYTGVNVWRDWDATATTIFSGNSQVPLLEQATRTEVLAGVTARLNVRLSLYGQTSYQFAVGSTNPDYRRDGFKGDVGLRYSW